jgi:hypothetical protein
MAALPAGEITFLFTDIEGSTRRWEQRPAAMRVALARHDALLREAIDAPLTPTDLAATVQAVQSAAALLDADTFAVAWAMGRAMSLAQAIDYALAEAG